MATREFAFTVHPALGGLDISSDPSTLDPNFLTIADNIEYREGGQRKKRPGHRIYSTAMAVSSASTAAGSIMVSTGASVRALGDYWRYGNSLTAVQDYVAVTGASIFHSTDGAGTWTPISVTSSFGLDANRTTNIIRAGDKVVFADSTSPPIAYDGTALVAATSGSLWPVFTAGRYHLNRLFYYGLSTAPSLFNYTAANNIFDSTGADAGGFTVNVGDGDQIIGVSDPFYASLYVFKGPHFGSIFQLAGATASNFALTQVAVGAPLLNNKALVTTPTDVYWLSQNGVHSLQTTVKFGNVEQAFLSLPIQRLWRDRLIDRTKIGEAWGFWHPQRNMVGWCVTPQGDTTQHWILCYNYALSDPKPGGKKFWSIWKTNVTHAHPSGAVMIVGSADTTHAGDPNLFLGTMEGQVWDGDQDYADASLNDAGEAYTASVRTPVITRFKSEKGISPETMEKSFCGVVTYFNPKGSYSADLTANIDRRVQTATVPFQGAGDTLG